MPVCPALSAATENNGFRKNLRETIVREDALVVVVVIVVSSAGAGGSFGKQEQLQVGVTGARDADFGFASRPGFGPGISVRHIFRPFSRARCLFDYRRTRWLKTKQ